MNRVGGGALTVRVETLDAIAPDGPIALLKIDVEGFEKFVLAGGRSVLQRAACVFIEVSSTHFARFGYPTRDVLRMLLEAGLTLFTVPADRVLRPASTDFDTPGTENIVALRDVVAGVRKTGWAIR